MEKDIILLKGIKKINAPFKLPEGYLEKNAEHIFADATKNKRSIKLKSLPKSTIYRIPQQYFQQLPERIFERISNRPLDTKIKPFWPKKRTIVSGIAALIVMGVLFWLSVPRQQDFLEKDNFAEVSSTEMYAFLTSQDIVAEEVLENQDLTKQQADSLLIDQVDYSDREIIKFLEDYNEQIEL
jgi:hypothetical protein